MQVLEPWAFQTAFCSGHRDITAFSALELDALARDSACRFSLIPSAFFLTLAVPVTDMPQVLVPGFALAVYKSRVESGIILSALNNGRRAIFNEDPPRRLDAGESPTFDAAHVTCTLTILRACRRRAL